MKTLYVSALLFLSLFFPKNYAVSPPISPIVPKAVKAPQIAVLSQSGRVYTQAEIDEMTQNTFHPYILRTLIRCESQNTDVARIDSNGKMSYGLLQFQKTTWDDFSALSGIKGSPMDATTAIAMADWAISNNFLHRWTCAYITGLLK